MNTVNTFTILMFILLFLMLSVTIFYVVTLVISILNSKLFSNRFGKIINGLLCIILLVFSFYSTFSVIRDIYQETSDFETKNLQIDSINSFVFNQCTFDKLTSTLFDSDCKIKYYDYMGNIVFDGISYKDISLNRKNDDIFSMYISKLGYDTYKKSLKVEEIVVQENINNINVKPIKDIGIPCYSSVSDYYYNQNDIEKLGIRTILYKDLLFNVLGIDFCILVFLAISSIYFNINLNKENKTIPKEKV